MATIGQLLTAPEPGWKRYDHHDPYFVYLGTWSQTSDTQSYGNSFKYTNTMGSKVNFSFSGTKVRIISYYHTGSAKDCKITIDGVTESFNTNSTTALRPVLAYEKSGLSEGVHNVTIEHTESTSFYTRLDAVDIDDTGELIPTLGSTLPTPTAGWKRTKIDQGNTKALGSTKGYSNSYFNDYVIQTTDGKNVVFKMLGGGAFRLLVRSIKTTPAKLNVTVNGTFKGTYDVGNYETGFQTLVFEDNLPDPALIEISSIGTNYIDAVDTKPSTRILHPDEVLNPFELTTGKRIRCNYKVESIGSFGTLSNLGLETTQPLNPKEKLDLANGDFYFIMVEEKNGQKMLIADRNIQTHITIDTLNNEGIAHGSGVTISQAPFDANLVPPLTNVNPTMEGRASSSAYLSNTYHHFKAFDFTTTTNWQSTTGHPQWLGFEYTEPKTVSKYSLTGTAVPERSPKSWTFEASEDGLTYIVLHTITNAPIWSAGEKRMYSISNTKAFKYYRVNISANYNTAYTAITEFHMYQQRYFRKNKALTFSLRLPTGGETSTSFDNEWDRFIVYNTNNGLSSISDDSVWNTSDVYSYTSTVVATNPNYRVYRGNSTPANYSSAATNNTHPSYGFRPVLLINENINPKYLVSEGLDLKAWDSNNGWRIVGTKPITDDVFINLGMDNVEIIPDTAWDQLGDYFDVLYYVEAPDILAPTASVTAPNTPIDVLGDQPEVLYRTEDIKPKTFQLTAVPKPKIVIQSVDKDISGINSFNISGGSSIKLLISGDSGLTFNSWNGNSWINVNPNSITAIKRDGMSVTTLNNLPLEKLKQMLPDKKVRFAYYLEQESSLDTNSKVEQSAIITPNFDSTPLISKVSVNYDQIDSKYFGLLFSDPTGSYYSTSLGEILKYLDYGVLVAGQTSLDVKVLLENNYNFSIKDIVLKINNSTLGAGVSVELSSGNNPFIPEEQLVLSGVTLQPGDKYPFFIRIVTNRSATDGGMFDIMVKANPV